MLAAGFPLKVRTKLNLYEFRREFTRVFGLISSEQRGIIATHLESVIWTEGRLDMSKSLFGITVGDREGASVAINASEFRYTFDRERLRNVIAHELRHVWQLAVGFPVSREQKVKLPSFEHYKQLPEERDAIWFAHHLVGGASDDDRRMLQEMKQFS